MNRYKHSYKNKWNKTKVKSMLLIYFKKMHNPTCFTVNVEGIRKEKHQSSFMVKKISKAQVQTKKKNFVLPF